MRNKVSQTIRTRIEQAGSRHFACDNVSEFIFEGEKDLLINELADNFEQVLQTLLIDTTNDPNSKGTAKRLAKMYINEIMEGRFTEAPEVTSFPNTDHNTRYGGILVAHCDLKSICSHHHQAVTLRCYIGLIPGTHVLGLSKYTRIAQHCARRGTLQEELTNSIADAIQDLTHTEDLAVQLVGRHGCMENRGCMSHNSGTYTAVMRGQFYTQSVKDEFFHAINQIRDMTNGQ